VQEELILQAMDVLENSGAAVALPSQTTMVTRDAGSTRKKQQQHKKPWRRAATPASPACSAHR